MNRLRRNWWSMLGSIAGWSAALGLLSLVHRAEMQSAATWTPDAITMLYLWAVASLLFGGAFWLITILIDCTALRSLSYGALIALKSLAMLLALLCYVLIRAAIAMGSDDETFSQAWVEGTRLLRNPLIAAALLYVLVTAVALNFVRQMSAMVGGRMLVNLLLGKYRSPQVETRIFMFLDLEGSTTIAERLGHQAFCRIIQECFRDLADVAIKRNVEIYQYVGDEAILTWSPSSGLLDCHCLRVFFDFDLALKRRGDFYSENFGVVPTFKAGANLGPVTVAEIGVIKRDIAYLSDVLNTAARLQSMCRQYEAGLLITADLNQALPKANDLIRESVGRVSVRGKMQQVEVFRVLAPPRKPGADAVSKDTSQLVGQ